ncbi:MAG: hypothetical protein LBV75_02465 [Paludibacter sp.]|jgi:hypothetical protein|nr:hypothetical protein [Paludibacter sp.]
MKPFYFFSLLLFTVLATSCESVFLKIYGVSEINKVETVDNILKVAKSYNIANENIYELDTAFYKSLELQKDTSNAGIIKNHLQPLQAMYFDKNGQMTAFYINCYAEGFPNLNWNQNNNFNVFPPVQQIGLSVDTLITFSKLQPYLTQISGNQQEIDGDYFVVVFWSKAFGRQSKHLVEIVKKNIELAQCKVNTMFVFSDNFFYKIMGE